VKGARIQELNIGIHQNQVLSGRVRKFVDVKIPGVALATLLNITNPIAWLMGRSRHTFFKSRFSNCCGFIGATVGYNDDFKGQLRQRLLQLKNTLLKCNYSEGGQKIKKPCPAYFSNDYIENLILNWREN